MLDSNPLVSIFIVTYNSEQYIIEALESVYAQTYHNIELIVSDDKSQDSTVQLVREWLRGHSDRFIRTKLIEAEVNTGTSGNYNRAVEACSGVWLKMLDGDDVLLPDCIQNNVSFVCEHPSSKVVFSKYQELYCEKKRIIKENSSLNLLAKFGNLSAMEQFKKLLYGNCLLSSSCFIESNLLKKNKYDENYSLLEDYPMWLRLTEQGVKFSVMDTYTVLYRKVESVSSSRGVLFPAVYTDQCRRFFYNYQLDRIRKYNLKEAYQRNRKYFLWYDMCEIFLRNKRNLITLPLYMMFKYIIFLLFVFKF